MTGSLFPPADRDMTPDGEETWVARVIVEPPNAQEHARRAVLDGPLRPGDIDRRLVQSDVDLLWLPFWRVTFAVADVESTVMVCARRAFPYEAKVRSPLAGALDGVTPLEIRLAELAPRGAFRESELAGEHVVADIGRSEAEARAVNASGARALSPRALVTGQPPEIRHALFCLYPLYFATCALDGEEHDETGAPYFVAVSGRTGKCVAQHLPSPLRAAASKLRRFLPFGS